MAVLNAQQIFLLLGSVSLFLQLIKDLEFMQVDSRKNYFMMGVTIPLVILTQNTWAYLGLSFVVFLFNYVIHVIEVKSKKEIFCDGDKEIMAWLVPGLIIFSLSNVLLFLVSFSALLLVFGVAQKHYKFLSDFVPGLTFICLSFVLSISLI